MNRRPFTMLTLAVVLTVLSVVAAPVARAGLVDEHREPVSFVIPAATCPLVASDITGEGEYHFRTVTQTRADGSFQVEFNLTATGQAWDAAGNQWRFNYHNHAVEKHPASEFPFTITTNDHFNLVGGGTNGNWDVGFTIRLTFLNATDPPIEEQISIRGIPQQCDVI